MLKPDKKKKKDGTKTPQGIVAKGNALRSVISAALLVVLVPVLLSFAYLMLIRDPAVNDQQLNRVASSFAAQQATSIQRFLQGMNERLAGAARSPLALQAIANDMGQDIALVEQAMLESVMQHTRSNQTRAAEVLGINRSTLRKKLKLYGLL